MKLLDSIRRVMTERGISATQRFGRLVAQLANDEDLTEDHVFQELELCDKTFEELESAVNLRRERMAHIAEVVAAEKQAEETLEQSQRLEAESVKLSKQFAELQAKSADVHMRHSTAVALRQRAMARAAEARTALHKCVAPELKIRERQLLDERSTIRRKLSVVRDSLRPLQGELHRGVGSTIQLDQFRSEAFSLEEQARSLEAELEGIDAELECVRTEMIQP